MTDSTRTLVVTMQDGSMRLVENVPSDAKVTFGEMHAGGKGNGGWTPRETCLRIYTSQSNQLAVFVGVREFRDTQVSVKKRVVVKGERSVKTKNDGKVLEVTDEMTEKNDWVADEF